MRVKLSSGAETEVVEAFGWYESKENGLGFDFLEILDEVLEQICHHPFRWPKAERSTRRARLSRFPYLIYYQVRPEEIFVVATAHTSRRPGYWRGRATKK